MGYRSDVVMTAPKELVLKHPELKATINDADEVGEYKYYKDKNSSPEIILVVKWEGWKWYSSYPYPEVAVVEDFKDKYRDEVSFVRIGEETDDIETQYGDRYDISVTRSVEPSEYFETINTDELFEENDND